LGELVIDRKSDTTFREIREFLDKKLSIEVEQTQAHGRTLVKELGNIAA
jgi:hypothetical protein